MVPALMGRVVQLTVNTWLGLQLKSVAPIPCGSLLQVFTDIELGRQWEPLLPSAYLVIPPRDMTGYPISISGGTTLTPSTAGSTLTPMTAAASGTAAGSTSHTAGTAPSNSGTSSSPYPNAVVRNLAYNETAFQSFKALGIKSRLLKDQLRARGVSYPTNANGAKMCITYHVSGMCNERCSVRADHTTHTAAEDETLKAWCTEHYHLT